jgi:hypothetical protein
MEQAISYPRIFMYLQMLPSNKVGCLIMLTKKNPSITAGDR